MEQIGSNEVPKSKVNKERVNTKKYLFGKRCVTQEDCQDEGRSTTVCHIKTHEEVAMETMMQRQTNNRVC